MQRDWRDFKALYGNIAGAREAFEKACESLFRKMYSDKNVKSVAVKKGDGGIDVFIGEMGIKPITVIQCKFFLEEFGDAQKGQIRESFKTAIESNEYELENWILCVPRELPIDEASWWSKWKSKMLIRYRKPDNFITLKNGNELIDLMKTHKVYDSVFQIVESLLIKDTNEKISKLFYSGLDDDLKDLGIIDEVFNYIKANRPRKASDFKTITVSAGIDLIPKIKLNFPHNQQKSVGRLMKKTWDKKETVRKFIETQIQEDEVSVNELIFQIQDDFCMLRGSDNPNAKIEDIEIIRNLSLNYLPDKKKKNIHYIANSEALIFYFFELCYIGDKTEKQKNQQSSLFD